jgi:1-deoxy-D-xylulose-5-phosphate reductoisomerase
MVRRSVAAANAANGTMAGRFLDRRIGFLDIAAAVEETSGRMSARADLKAHGDIAMAQALQLDRAPRRIAAQVVAHQDTPKPDLATIDLEHRRP